MGLEIVLEMVFVSPLHEVQEMCWFQFDLICSIDVCRTEMFCGSFINNPVAYQSVMQVLPLPLPLASLNDINAITYNNGLIMPKYFNGQ